MNLIKTSAITAGLVGAFALGVWTGPSLTESIRDGRIEATPPVSHRSEPTAVEEAPKPATRVTRVVNRPPANPFEPVLVAADSSVQKAAKSVLNQGTNVEMAAAGFRDAELFVSTAYAARNTGIPFMLLKERMLSAGQTLSEAIRQSKPDIDAVAEMERARTKARSVIAQLAN